MELKEGDVLRQKYESDMEGMKVEVERYKGIRDDARMHMDKLRVPQKQLQHWSNPCKMS